MYSSMNRTTVMVQTYWYSFVWNTLSLTQQKQRACEITPKPNQFGKFHFFFFWALTVLHWHRGCLIISKANLSELSFNTLHWKKTENNRNRGGADFAHLRSPVSLLAPVCRVKPRALHPGSRRCSHTGWGLIHSLWKWSHVFEKWLRD